MIAIDEHIQIWNDHLLGSEGVRDAIIALIIDNKRLREQLVRAKKIIHSLAGQSDSAMMDYEDYIEGDEEE